MRATLFFFVFGLSFAALSPANAESPSPDPWDVEGPHDVYEDPPTDAAEPRDIDEAEPDVPGQGRDGSLECDVDSVDSARHDVGGVESGTDGGGRRDDEVEEESYDPDGCQHLPGSGAPTSALWMLVGIILVFRRLKGHQCPNDGN